MRTVLHCDMNNYFASVETVDMPGLASVPMAVCGDPRLRHGVVLAKNEHAKRYGVTTGESAASAKMKCPGLVVVPTHYRKYQVYSSIARSIFSRFSEEIYPYGMDEAWLVLP
ncbi:MAG: DNA polymerase IV, partial [Clostridia bacterium]|nr:DNA polymerase IV [Clostridia bacterium]